MDRSASSDERLGATVSASNLDRDLVGLLHVEELCVEDVSISSTTGGKGFPKVAIFAVAPLFKVVCLLEEV